MQPVDKKLAAAVLKTVIGISPYLSCESSSFNEIWYADVHFDSQQRGCMDACMHVCTCQRLSMLALLYYNLHSMSVSITILIFTADAIKPTVIDIYAEHFIVMQITLACLRGKGRIHHDYH